MTERDTTSLEAFPLTMNDRERIGRPPPKENEPSDPDWLVPSQSGQALEAIVLAAGASARFGGAKLLARLDGAPLIAGALLTAFLSPVRRVHVAVASDAVRKVVKATAERL